MKKLLIISGLLLVSNSSMFSQNSIDSILAKIKMNNTELIALQKQVKAQKIGNKTGNSLQNPELEFNYLWGNPSNIGNRTDFSIMQSFDFPTAYGYRNQIADLKNEQIEFEHQKQEKDILLQAKLHCIELTSKNALHTEMTKRLAHAQIIADAYTVKFKNGETNILEYNKAHLNLLNISKELELVEFEQKTLLSELEELNGGQHLTFKSEVFETFALASDFEKWYMLAEKNNPILNWLKEEMQINQKQLKLHRANSLPKFQAGYMNENTIGEKFQGISLGMSIPLWENKNKVKYAQANSLATRSIADDNKLLFYNHLKSLYNKARDLEINVTDYRTRLESLDNSELLKKALDAGEISLVNYILDLSIYYESFNNLLDLEKEMNIVLAEMNQYM